MEKSDLFAYLRFCACEEKNIEKSLQYVGPTKVVKVLYEQKLVYWDQLIN